MADMSNPHDRHFRETLAHPEAARDFLRYYLPADVAALIDPVEPPELKSLDDLRHIYAGW